MKPYKLFWILPLAITVGCVKSHQPRYAVVPATTTPVSTRETVRVYPSTTTTVPTTTTVVTAPPKVITTTPSTVVTTPSTVISAPAVVTELPPDLPPTTVASADNLTVAESIRRMLATDSALNSAARDVRISVYNGRVTLTGQTDTVNERQRLQSAIASVPGVTRVDDRLTVD